MRLLFSLLALVLLLPGLARAQGVAVVAVPPLAISEEAIASDREIAVTALQIAQVIASDLRGSNEILALSPEQLSTYSLPEASAPSFRTWRATGAKMVVTGFVQRRPDGRLTVGCYLHDIASTRELGRVGFAVAAGEWRRAAHRCADLAYTKITGRPGWFDSRIAYVSESGAGAARLKRLAMMDADGSNHRFLTAGDALVVTPSLAPDGTRLAYVSLAGGRAHVRIVDLGTDNDRALLPGGEAMSFAPRFSPDGKRLLLTIANGGNSDIYLADADGGGLQRLTFSPGVDTGGSFSPDGRRIVFESDRSGTPQLYVMDANGAGARRISFGGGRYTGAAWSPDGDLIAFTRLGPEGLRVGVMNPSGGGEKLLTAGPMDEGPSWSGSSRHVLFQRTIPGRSSLYLVAVDGGEPRLLATPVGGTDPDWTSAGAGR